jgi:hypothetical protein
MRSFQRAHASLDRNMVYWRIGGIGGDGSIGNGFVIQ